MADANKKQVGGSHYAGEYQHWDLIIDIFGPEYLIGCATKYVSRWRKKNGVQDLEKAIHYLEKAKECGFHILKTSKMKGCIDRFIRSTFVGGTAAPEYMVFVAIYNSEWDLAIDEIRDIITNAKAAEPQSGAEHVV